MMRITDRTPRHRRRSGEGKKVNLVRFQRRAQGLKPKEIPRLKMMFSGEGLIDPYKSVTLTVYKWNQMDPNGSIWFHLYTVRVKGETMKFKSLRNTAHRNKNPKKVSCSKWVNVCIFIFAFILTLRYIEGKILFCRLPGTSS